MESRPADKTKFLGFHTCAYGNLFEYGWDVPRAWPNKTIDCSPAATTGAGHESQRLLCHSQRLLREKYGEALIFKMPGKVPPYMLCGGMSGSCIMDPSPDLPYLEHLLDMARTSIAKTPSAGTCIDRQDWIGHVNPVSTRILGRRTAPFPPFLIPYRVPHGVTPRS